MDFDDSISILRRVKELGFREEEIGIPIPSEGPGKSEVPSAENFSAFLEAQQESPHRSRLLSDFAYTPKGAFAFAPLAMALAAAAGEPAAGAGISAFRFAKVKTGNFSKAIRDAREPGRQGEAFSLLKPKAGGGRELEAQVVVHGDGKSANCHIKVGGGWRKLFSIPITEGVWPVGGREFLIAYAYGKNVYGSREFSPSLGNLVSALGPDAEYGWIEERKDAKALSFAAAGFAGIYVEENSLPEGREFAGFFALSCAKGNGAYAEMGGKTMHSPEFFANINYMLARAEYEKGKGNEAEALFHLRTCADLAFLSLRASPLGGRMLELSEFFHACENMAGKVFTLDKGAIAFLESLGADFGNGGKIRLTGGKDYSVQAEKVSMSLGTLAWVALSSGFLHGGKNAFWKELRSQGAILLVASYAGGPRLALLEEDTEVARGSDVLKMELSGQKLLVKRAMALESGKGKEIKAHLARIIEVADRRSLDESALISEMGSWGEAVYGIARGAGTSVLALEGSRRFY